MLLGKLSTLAKPVYDLSRNEDFFGKPIMDKNAIHMESMLGNIGTAVGAMRESG